MSRKLIIGIVDDNQVTREQVKNKIEEILEQIEVVATFALYGDGSEIVASKIIHDIILLDHEMPILNGISTMVELNKLTPKPLVIFLTGIKHPLEVVRDSVSLHPFDFLLKDDGDEKIEETVLKAISEITNKKFISITHYKRNKNRTEIKLEAKVYINDIVNLFVEGKVCYINAKPKEEYMTRKAMTFWLNQLPQNEFIRVTKQNVVNLRNVDKFEDDIVHLINGEELELSRKYKKEFKEAFSQYLLSGGK